MSLSEYWPFSILEERRVRAAQREELVTTYAEFREYYRDDPEELEMAEAYLNAQPPRLPIEPDFGEYDKRLSLIRQIAHEMRSQHPVVTFTNAHVGILLQASTQKLQEKLAWLKGKPKLTEVIDEWNCIENLPHLVRHFVKPQRYNGCASNETAPEKATKKRDEARCIVTNSRMPSVRRIIPSRWDCTEAAVAETASLLRSLRIIMDHGELAGLIEDLTNTPHASNHPWNMVCIDEPLYVYWTAAFWAFEVLDDSVKPLTWWQMLSPTMWWKRKDQLKQREEQLQQEEETGKKIVTLRLHYMPLQGPEDPPMWHAKADLHHGLRDHLQPYEYTVGHNHDTSRRIYTGDIFKVAMDPAEAVKFVRIMRLQWILINACSMAGTPARRRTLSDSSSDTDVQSVD